jgi:hypothetical protein
MCEPLKAILLNGLAMAYAAGGIVCCIAYFPTIKDLYYHKKPSANTTTYALWTATAFITLLYSIFVATDILFRIISLANLIACSLVLSLSLMTIKIKDNKSR